MNRYIYILPLHFPVTEARWRSLEVTSRGSGAASTSGGSATSRARRLKPTPRKLYSKSRAAGDALSKVTPVDWRLRLVPPCPRTPRKWGGVTPVTRLVGRPPSDFVPPTNQSSLRSHWRRSHSARSDVVSGDYVTGETRSHKTSRSGVKQGQERQKEVDSPEFDQVLFESV